MAFLGFKLFHVVSIHALLAECDGQPRTTKPKQKGFNPRTPCGVRLKVYINIAIISQFQSTHSLRSATVAHTTVIYPTGVSIHALLAECDGAMGLKAVPIPCFNPRTPCGVRPQQGGRVRLFPRFNPRTPCGVRQKTGKLSHGRFTFQSTHSLRSATQAPVLGGDGLIVSIHALLAECDVPDKRLGDVDYLVSIHALLAECDYNIQTIKH